MKQSLRTIKFLLILPIYILLGIIGHIIAPDLFDKMLNWLTPIHEWYWKLFDKE